MQIKLKFPNNCDSSDVQPYFISEPPTNNPDKTICDFKEFGYKGDRIELFNVKKEGKYLVLDINENLLEH